mmetsp:Transcript_14139/g.38249  ORF Transcript_14139/g.38249 Transcript_14139/m.38249 type:complete len:230 (+) Transcript_14139:946-1635(+)
MVDLGLGLWSPYPASLLGSREHKVKMLCLPCICDINDPVCLLNLQTVLKGSHICRGVAKATIALLDDERDALALHKHADSPIAELCAALFLELLHYPFQHWVIEGLPPLLDLDAQAFIDSCKLLPACCTDGTPHLQALLIARLEGGHSLSCALLEAFIIIKPLLGSPVQFHEIRNGLIAAGTAIGAWAELTHVLDEHAELRAPIPDVVEAEHLCTTQLQRAADGVSDDG